MKINLPLVALLLTVLSFSCSRPAEQQATSDTLSDASPVISNETISLYAEDAIEQKGPLKKLASHFEINGRGQMTWRIDIPEADEYELALGYSIQTQGAVIEIRSGETTVTDTLLPTSGVYAEHGQWYQLNFERQLLPQRLALTKGENLITFRVKTPPKDSLTAFYALELNPRSKKAEINEEVARARQARISPGWFTSSTYGLMFHWTSQSAPRNGETIPYKEAVARFDVAAFVEMVNSTGADYIIFTANHADPHFPAPLKEWEKIHPGWTTDRDLITEIADGLKAHDIKLFLYFATHVYAKYQEVEAEEFTRINRSLITEVGERYKDKIAGYWLDGWYQCYRLFPDFPFESFYQDCKKGNPERLLALNSWLYPIISEWQDYWAGEIYSIGTPPTHSIIASGPGKGLPYHALLSLEGGWVFSEQNSEIGPPVLEEEALKGFIASCQGKGPVTINTLIYQDGTIGNKSLKMLQQLRNSFSSD